jgi:FMN phosphatase YigB (HAD superfamily)
MSIKVILFDLDGTLLPMDQELFIKTYFGRIAAWMSKYGYDPKKLVSAIMLGTRDMIQNDGKVTNEQVFWDAFCGVFGKEALADMQHFESFYVEDFDNVKTSCGYDERAAQTVKRIKDMGFVTALATNPVFPPIATEKRMGWAGLSPEDFALYTTYENSSYCKPNPAYYLDVAHKLGVSPEECLMVGNDVSDDMVAARVGMDVFLLTDCLINKFGEDISVYPSGSFEQLLEYIEHKIVD